MIGMLAPCTCPKCGGAFEPVNVGKPTPHRTCAVLHCTGCDLEYVMIVHLALIEESARRVTPARRAALTRARTKVAC